MIGRILALALIFALYYFWGSSGIYLGAISLLIFHIVYRIRYGRWVNP